MKREHHEEHMRLMLNMKLIYIFTASLLISIIMTGSCWLYQWKEFKKEIIKYEYDLNHQK